jgi:plasmid stabilization system protein ParE
MLNINTSIKATDDLKKIIDWDEDQSPGLGDRFLNSMNTKVKRIAKQPQEFMFVSRNVQRAHLNKFPYCIFFTKEAQTIIILRVRHQKQKPIKRFR